MLLASGLHQVKPRLSEWLHPEPSLQARLRWETTSPDQPRLLTSGVLVREPPRKSLASLLGYIQTGAEWLFPTAFGTLSTSSSAPSANGVVSALAVG